MLVVNLLDLERGSVAVRGVIPAADPLWADSDAQLEAPLVVDLQAERVGAGVLVRGRVHTQVHLECRRCLAPIHWPIDEEFDLFFEPLEGIEDPGDSYPLPTGTLELALDEPLREQLLLRIPPYALCRDDCRGLCPGCGVDRNTEPCRCPPPPLEAGPWAALRALRFDL